MREAPHRVHTPLIAQRVTLVVQDAVKTAPVVLDLEVKIKDPLRRFANRLELERGRVHGLHRPPPLRRRHIYQQHIINRSAAPREPRRQVEVLIAQLCSQRPSSPRRVHRRAERLLYAITHPFQHCDLVVCQHHDRDHRRARQTHRHAAHLTVDLVPDRHVRVPEDETNHCHQPFRVKVAAGVLVILRSTVPAVALPHPLDPRRLVDPLAASRHAQEPRLRATASDVLAVRAEDACQQSRQSPHDVCMRQRRIQRREVRDLKLHPPMMLRARAVA